MPALEDAANAAETGPAVLVTHDAVIRALLVPLSPDAASATFPTGCWSLLTRSGAQWAVGPIGQNGAGAPHSEGGTGYDGRQ